MDRRSFLVLPFAAALVPAVAKALPVKDGFTVFGLRYRWDLRSICLDVAVDGGARVRYLISDELLAEGPVTIAGGLHVGLKGPRGSSRASIYGYSSPGAYWLGVVPGRHTISYDHTAS